MHIDGVIVWVLDFCWFVLKNYGFRVGENGKERVHKQITLNMFLIGCIVIPNNNLTALFMLLVSSSTSTSTTSGSPSPLISWLMGITQIKEISGIQSLLLQLLD